MKSGIYIHVPFCIKKCGYCDFYSEKVTDNIERYIENLALEIELCKKELFADTIYFGGGTPSILSFENLLHIIAKVKENFIIDEESEITVETNPGTVDLMKLKSFKEIGINRLNIGIQSFNDNNLGFLERIHTSKQAQEVFSFARECDFDNIGIDIIYGLPGQTKRDLKEDLKRAISLNPEHISAYTLTFEEGTPITEKLEKGEIKSPGEGKVSELFLFCSEFLMDNGYEHYEISNFAKPEKFSRHNIKYWNLAEYLGFGPSAHSYSDRIRWWNKGTLKEYNEVLESGCKPVAESEKLSREQIVIEHVYLGLRQRRGIDIKKFEKKFNTVFPDILKKTEEFINNGLMVHEDNYLSLTTKGMTLHDHIVLKIIEDL